jgi:hypothetical protein
MPKKEILELQSAPRLEQVGDNRPKQMEHRNHRVDDELILPHRANRADGIFGNDNRRAVLPESKNHSAIHLVDGSNFRKGQVWRALVWRRLRHIVRCS